jgi:hypothetical protein
MLAVVAVFWGVTRSGQDGFAAHMGEHVLVKVEVAQLQDAGVRFAEIELPAGVSFYSERYPELKDKRTVVLALSDAMKISNLPIVIQSEEAGKKQIKIRFQNAEHETLKEKEVTIRFQAA